MRRKILDMYIKYSSLWNILIALSAATATALVSLGNFPFKNMVTVFNCIVMFTLSFYFLTKKKVFENQLQEKYILGKNLDFILAFFFACTTVKELVHYFSYYDSLLKTMMNIISSGIGVQFAKIWLVGRIGLFFIAIPFIWLLYLCMIRKLFPKIKQFFCNLSKVERKYLWIFNLAFLVLVLFINLQTNAFTVPHENGGGAVQGYGVLYSTDTGVQVHNNAFQNALSSENDLRQPLFALFSFPFGQIAGLGAFIFGFVPTEISYSVFLVLLQGFVLSICSILLSRMMRQFDSIACLSFFSFMYATIFFSLNIEQYVFGIFWLMILVYHFVMKNESNPWLFSAATGSLITNAIWLPFILPKKKFKEYFLEGLKYGLIFLALLIVFGQTSRFISDLVGFSKYNEAMGFQLTFVDKLLQFINFIASCFIAPTAKPCINCTDHASYEMLPVTSLNILGLILLVIMIISFIWNRKEKIAQVGFGWLLFSFLILCLIGWGTADNELFIYGIYFSWAYFVLIYLFLHKLLQSFPKIEKWVIFALCLLLIVVNGHEIYNIIVFGKAHYPFKL